VRVTDPSALQAHVDEIMGHPARASSGTTNRNARGGSESRRRRREWLVATYRADMDVLAVQVRVELELLVPVELGHGEPACRCYRCGALLTVATVSADRIKPGCQGGTYRRDNIRPACAGCQSTVGGATRSNGKGSGVPARRSVRNTQREASGRGGRVRGVERAERKDSACLKCGAKPGHSCVTLTSKRQVERGVDGAYLKPQRTLHTGRGMVS
jgi:hypothetical protein